MCRGGYGQSHKRKGHRRVYIRKSRLCDKRKRSIHRLRLPRNRLCSNAAPHSFDCTICTTGGAWFKDSPKQGKMPSSGLCRKRQKTWAYRNAFCNSKRQDKRRFWGASNEDLSGMSRTIVGISICMPYMRTCLSKAQQGVSSVSWRCKRRRRICTYH